MPHELEAAPHVLQCMDIWSGNRSIESTASTPNFDIAVCSQPYQGDRRGGDVHYVSLCAGGVVTRLILADVSGHGNAVAETSKSLRDLMRRFMNTKSQDRLVRALNREFTQLSHAGRFATAIVATYLRNKGRFTLCNAGHPRPLWYCRRTGAWLYADHELAGDKSSSNLPWGIDESAAYEQFSLPLEDGDLLVFYTDALTESRGGDDKLLGESGLLRIAELSNSDNVNECRNGILRGIQEFTGNRPADDDMTLLVLRYFARRPHHPGIGEKLNAYARLLGLKKV